MKRKVFSVLAAVLLVTFSGCSVSVTDGVVNIEDTPSSETYSQITQQEAKKVMDSGENIIILDVRRKDEYDEGHIPGAILLPNENIRNAPPEELPDMSQKILIYCRSGNRSKQAARRLAKMGYANVYEFGGIRTWPYDIVKGGEITAEPMTEAETVPAAEPATTASSPSALLTSTADIGLYDSDGQDYHYVFAYNSEYFNAYYTPDNWCVIDSYKISNKTDLEIICQALADVHPIHSADMSGWRTPQDMAYEWTQHNIAYSLLSDDSPWKESAKDVDIDPPDQGKSVYQLFKDRISEGEQ